MMLIVSLSRQSSEWLVDYQPPDGADREGWQYATDFPSRYHGHKGPFDYVRRRRWQRRRRLATVGPWLRFGLTKLLDVSMQVRTGATTEDAVLVADLLARWRCRRPHTNTRHRPPRRHCFFPNIQGPH